MNLESILPTTMTEWEQVTSSEKPFATDATPTKNNKEIVYIKHREKRLKEASKKQYLSTTQMNNGV